MITLNSIDSSNLCNSIASFNIWYRKSCSIRGMLHYINSKFLCSRYFCYFHILFTFEMFTGL